MTLSDAMQLLYDNEINCCIHSFWDGGWYVRIGDSVNGYKVSTEFDELDGAGDWLIEQAEKLYPDFEDLRDQYP